MSLHGGRDGHELLTGNGVARERRGAHDAGDHAGGTRAQTTGDGHLGGDVDGNGEGLLTPLGKGIHEALVDEVVLVLELLWAARDGEGLGAVEGEVRVQRDGHAQGIVADA